MFGIVWASMHNLRYILPLLVGVTGLLLYRFIAWQRAIDFLASGIHVRAMVVHFSLLRRAIRTLLFFVGTLGIALALLQPQWTKREHVVHQEGRDLFIALDISRSMLASDCKPNRLACAKAKIKQLLKALSCERVGLILFSGASFVQCPLTTDYGAFALFLDQIDAETISSGSTALDRAIKKALSAFQSLPERTHKLLVLVTDGEDFSHDLVDVRRQAHESSMHIITLGIGTAQGAPVPCFDERGNPKGHQKDAQGAVVISHLNEAMLQAIAQESGGQYIRSTSDDADIKKIVQVVSLYEKNKMEDRTVSCYEEQYPWFIAVSLLCFCVEWLL